MSSTLERESSAKNRITHEADDVRVLYEFLLTMPLDLPLVLVLLEEEELPHQVLAMILAVLSQSNTLIVEAFHHGKPVVEFFS